MMPEVKMRLDKLRFSISEGLGFAEGRLGESVALTAIFRDLEVRAKELEDAITFSCGRLSRNSRHTVRNKDRRTNQT